MDEQGFSGVASSHVVGLSSVSCPCNAAHLGLDGNSDGLVGVGAGVQIHGTDAIGMPHYWNPRRVLYASHELIAPSRHDEVNVSVLGEQRRDL